MNNLKITISNSDELGLCLMNGEPSFDCYVVTNYCGFWHTIKSRIWFRTMAEAVAYAASIPHDCIWYAI